MKFKKRTWRELVGIVALFSFIISIAYVVFRIINAPSESNIEAVRVKSDYVLMLIQCILGLVAMELPNMISKKMRLEIPSNMYIAYVVFLYSAIFLGEVRNFYYNFTHWDVILHAFSGAMLGALGFSIVSIINNEKKNHVTLSPLFVAIFAFTFAVTLGVFWEIYEFAFDGILSLNMQKFKLQTGLELVGRNALMDTMKDLIVDCIGAGIMCIIGYISLKHKKGWIDSLVLRFKKDSEE